MAALRGSDCRHYAQRLGPWTLSNGQPRIRRVRSAQRFMEARMVASAYFLAGGGRIVQKAQKGEGHAQEGQRQQQ